MKKFCSFMLSLRETFKTLRCDIKGNSLLVVKLYNDYGSILVICLSLSKYSLGVGDLLGSSAPVL